MATLGCIKARMGDTDYYIAKISAGELIDRVGIAKEMPEWPDMSAEEKMQRECDIRRPSTFGQACNCLGQGQVAGWLLVSICQLGIMAGFMADSATR